MTNNEYLANELAAIGIRFSPASKEHHVIDAIIEILAEQDRAK